MTSLALHAGNWHIQYIWTCTPTAAECWGVSQTCGHRFLADEKAAAEEEASEAARRRGDQPTLAQAAALAAEAEDLPVDAELKTRLDEIVHAGEDWEARCAAVLNPKQVRALLILEQC